MFSQAKFLFVSFFDRQFCGVGSRDEKDIWRTHKITQLWRNFVLSYVSLFSHSFYQKYIMMKFKWQLNFDTIHIMRSGENRRRMRKEKKNGKHNMICMCVVLLTCVNFNELAFIIYHVPLKHPFSSLHAKTSHTLDSFSSCCVSLANCDPPELCDVTK
jgi:hypothetical protein